MKWLAHFHAPGHHKDLVYTLALCSRSVVCGPKQRRWHPLRLGKFQGIILICQLPSCRKAFHVYPSRKHAKYCSCRCWGLVQQQRPSHRKPKHIALPSISHQAGLERFLARQHARTK